MPELAEWVRKAWAVSQVVLLPISTSCRAEFRPETFNANADSVTSALIGCLTAQQRILASYYGLDYDTTAVYVVIALSAVQKAVREPDPPPRLKSFLPLVPADVGSVSRRAVAEATGLPRETVRRIVAELIAGGMVTESGRNGVNAGFARYSLPLEARPTRRYVDEVVQLTNTLLELGTIGLRDRAASRHPRPNDEEMVKSDATGKLSLNLSRFTANARLAAYGVMNCLLEQQRILSEQLAMNYDTLAVFLCIALASTMPSGAAGPISRRAVAAVTGLPRETVRRIVAGLLAEGQVSASGRDGVTTSFLTTPPAHELTRRCIEPAIQMINTLLRLGVLEA